MFGCVFHDSLKRWLPIWSSCSAGSRGWVWFLHSLIPRKDTASRGCVLTRLACHSCHESQASWGKRAKLHAERWPAGGQPSGVTRVSRQAIGNVHQGQDFLPKCTWLCQLYSRAQGGGDTSPPECCFGRKPFYLGRGTSWLGVRPGGINYQF